MSTRTFLQGNASTNLRFANSALFAVLFFMLSTSLAIAQSGTRNPFTQPERQFQPRQFKIPGKPPVPEADRQPQFFSSPSDLGPLTPAQPYYPQHSPPSCSSNQCESSFRRLPRTLEYRSISTTPVPIYRYIDQSPRVRSYRYPLSSTPYSRFNAYRTPSARSYIQAYPSCRGY